MCLFTLMLNPAFALVSMKKAPSSRALLSPSSIETCLLNHQEQPHLKFFNQINEAIQDPSTLV